MEEDPIFKERFGISTPIRYVHELTVEPKWFKQYDREWRREYKKIEPTGSATLRKKFDAFLRRIEKDGDDAHYCQRIELRHINGEVGYGVFAKEDIPANSVLNQYAGLFRPDKVIDPENDSAFAFSDFEGYTIDGLIAGNWARFMNHASEDSPLANVVAWEHYSDWGPRIIFTSGKNGIKAGDQLLYSYGDEYWDGEPNFEEFE